MSGENWESLITEKGFMRVPRALRLKRAELGITNNEYTILLDYVDYYSFSGTMNPYRHLTEVSGMSERSVRRILTSLENKGLLKRTVNQHGNGRTRGVVFSIAPLVRKLKTMMKKMSSTVGDESVPYVGDISVPPNTGEEFNKKDEDENTSAKNADSGARGCEGESNYENGNYKRKIVPPHPDPLPRWGEGMKRMDEVDSARKGSKKGREYSPSKWYNEVWRGLYEETAGQPALTGGREYKSAETYFHRLRALNPEMEPEEIYMLAGEGAAFMIASQLEGGVFGWMHKPPDICMLASQAQSVEWHLRKMRRGGHLRDDYRNLESSSPSCPSPLMGEGINNSSGVPEGSDGGTGSVLVRFIEKIREVQDAGQEIDRVYGELRGIENASRGRAIQPGGRSLRRKRG